MLCPEVEKSRYVGKDLKGKNIGTGLSQRKDGTYCARAVIKGTKVCLYNKNLAKLKREFEEKKAEVLRDECGERPNVKLQDWFEEYKAPSLKSDISRKTYYRKINNTYIKIIGDKKVEDISQINIQMAMSLWKRNILTEQSKKRLVL